MSQVFLRIIPRLSLRGPIVTGGGWVGFGFVFAQLIRFASNLALTRILALEHFGVVALINTIVTGLTLISDVGVDRRLINSPRGACHLYQDVAWTIQALKGISIYLILLILSPLTENIYDIPSLSVYLSVAGLSFLINCLIPTSWTLLQREMRFKVRVLLEVFSQLIGVALMITLALLTGSIWALIIGGIASSISKFVLLNLFVSSRLNRFCFNKEMFHDIFGFGKWVFLSTLISFFSMHGDRLFLGKYVSPQELGIYSIAYVLAMMANGFVAKMSVSFLFPLCSKANIEGVSLNQFFFVRQLLIGFAWILTAFLSLSGALIIDFFYDERYADAGWILQVISLAGAFGVYGQSIQQLILSKGSSFTIFKIQVFRTVLLALLLYALGRNHGVAGVTIVLVIVSCISSVISLFYSKSFGHRLWLLDCFGMVVFGGLILCVWMIFDFPVFLILTSLLI